MRMSTLASAVSAVAVLAWSALGVAAAAPSTCADLDGVLDASQICQIQATDPGYSVNISYPVDYPDATPVFDYVKETRDGFLNVARTPDSRTMPYELDTTQTEFSSTVPPHQTQSVVFKTYQGVGGAHPTTFYKSFTWDQTLRRPITIDNLFKEGAAPFPVIFPLVQTELEKQLGSNPAIAPEVGLNPSTYENFAITNDSLIFFFGQGAIQPESAGALQVSIPRGPVDAMIA